MEHRDSLTGETNLDLETFWKDRRLSKDHEQIGKLISENKFFGHKEIFSEDSRTKRIVDGINREKLPKGSCLFNQIMDDMSGSSDYSSDNSDSSNPDSSIKRKNRYRTSKLSKQILTKNWNFRRLQALQESKQIH